MLDFEKPRKTCKACIEGVICLIFYVPTTLA